MASELARGGPSSVSKESPFDVVTPADAAIERFLRERVADAFPDHGFVGEEEGGAFDGREWQWVVDPVDGTLNYATGLAGATCSIACLRDGRPIVGVIADFSTGAVYGARAGTHVIARRDGHNTVQVQPSRTAVGAGRVFLDFGWEGIRDIEAGTIERLRHGRPRFIRMVGGAAYALLHVALNGGAFLAVGLRRWDVAAGLVLVSESGLEVRLRETPPTLNVVAGTHDDVTELWPIVNQISGQQVAAVPSRVGSEEEGAWTGEFLRS
jgi:myo-inositol-1(or 4)-monophosphatase